MEDNRDSADSLSEALTLLGHRVIVAYDAETALAKAREFHPEAVICDIGLPDMTGYALAAALRSESSASAALLIALTGFAQPEDERCAFEAGFNAHLAKPPDLAALEHLLADSR